MSWQYKVTVAGEVTTAAAATAAEAATAASVQKGEHSILVIRMGKKDILDKNGIL